LENKLKQFEDQFSSAIEILNQITIERGKQTQLIQNIRNKFKLVRNNLDKSKSLVNSIFHLNAENNELQLLDENLGEVQNLSEKLLEKYSQAIGQLEEVNDTIDINSNKLIEIEKQKKAKYASIYEFKQMRGIEGEKEFFLS
jgi:DNA repair ATPase RecN